MSERFKTHVRDFIDGTLSDKDIINARRRLDPRHPVSRRQFLIDRTLDVFAIGSGAYGVKHYRAQAGELQSKPAMDEDEKILKAIDVYSAYGISSISLALIVLGGGRSILDSFKRIKALNSRKIK